MSALSKDARFWLAGRGDSFMATILSARRTALTSSSSPSRCVGQINSHCGRVTANKLIDSAHPEALDELPQLWNIVKGDMSLVGPRPERPVFCKAFERRIPGWRYRTKVRPGLSGLAQVTGGYDLLPKEKVVLDLEYIRTRTFRGDLRIIFRTLGIVGSGSGSR